MQVTEASRGILLWQHAWPYMDLLLLAKHVSKSQFLFLTAFSRPLQWRIQDLGGGGGGPMGGVATRGGGGGGGPPRAPWPHPGSYAYSQWFLESSDLQYKVFLRLAHIVTLHCRPLDSRNHFS